MPDKNKLRHVDNFEDVALALAKSRLSVGWMAAGVATGAYENALKYTLQR